MHAWDEAGRERSVFLAGQGMGGGPDTSGRPESLCPVEQLLFTECQ